MQGCNVLFWSQRRNQALVWISRKHSPVALRFVPCAVELTCWAAYACGNAPDRHTAVDAHRGEVATGQQVASIAGRAAGCPTDAGERLCVCWCGGGTCAVQWPYACVARQQCIKERKQCNQWALNSTNQPSHVTWHYYKSAIKALQRLPLVPASHSKVG
jgi:hypothetical protein